MCVCVRVCVCGGVCVCVQHLIVCGPGGGGEHGVQCRQILGCNGNVSTQPPQLCAALEITRAEIVALANTMSNVFVVDMWVESCVECPYVLQSLKHTHTHSHTHSLTHSLSSHACAHERLWSRRAMASRVAPSLMCRCAITTTALAGAPSSSAAYASHRL